MAIDERRKDFKPELWENKDCPLPNVSKQRNSENIFDVDYDNPDFPMIEQVWFAGVHCNIGGFYMEDGLSNISLKWMVNKGLKHNLIFKKNNSKALTTTTNNIIKSTEELTEFAKNDFLDKIIDSSKGLWNLRPKESRKIPENSRIHESVIKRINHADANYKPNNFPKNYLIVDDDGNTIKEIKG